MVNQLPGNDSSVFMFHDLILWTDDLTNKTYYDDASE